MNTKNETPEPKTEIKQEACGDRPSTPCCVSLVWMPGPANGGGGTAEHEEHATHRSWWYDGQLLLVVVDTNSGPEVSTVRVNADGDMLGFTNAATGDDDFGWTDTDISWWAILDDILPHNAATHAPGADEKPLK